MRKFQRFNRTAMAIAVSTVFLLSACASGGGGSGANDSGNTAPPMPTTPNPNNPSTTLPPGSGGGGGGGGGGSSSTTQRSSVPFGTPTAQGSAFSPYAAPSNSFNVSTNYVVDNLTGSGGQSLVVAGRMTQTSASSWQNTAIQIFDWSGTSLNNVTSKWLPGTTGQIVGTDPTVQFADFFKSGKTDMFVAPSTDGSLANSGPAVLFKNNGNSFDRTDIPLSSVWAHGATVGSLNRDGWLDIAMSDYGANTTLLVNNKVNNFVPYIGVNDATGAKALQWGGSSIAMGNFKGDGSTYLVVTDNTCQDTATGCSNATSTHMYSWNLSSKNGSIGSKSTLETVTDPVTNVTTLKGGAGQPSTTTLESNTTQLTYGFAKNLPTQLLPHNILALAYDFAGNGRDNLIIFSRASSNTKQSAIQFLLNDGSGNFSDVTGSFLSGYNTNTNTTYKPQFVDLGNGQQSMIVSGTDFSGANTSTQILVKQSAGGPYVAAYQNVMTDFTTQVNQIANNANNSGNQVNVVKDKSGNMYLVSTAQQSVGGQMKMQVYISPLGTGANTTTVASALNSLKVTWPYMSSTSANTLLAQTAATYMTEAGQALIINGDAITKPVGGLNINTHVGSLMSRGYIGGVKLETGNAVAIDAYGRDFSINLSQTNYIGPNAFGSNSEHIDQYGMTSHAEYLINAPTNTIYTPMGPMRIGYEDRNRFNTFGVDGNGANIGGMPRQYSIGLPEIYRNGNFITGMQYTNLTTNPWFNFNGAWGTVTNSGVLEQHVTYASNGFSVQGALTHTSTTFTPGMITRITPITGTWAESGYRYADYGNFGDLGLYMGVKPIVLSGSLTANVPTSVDNHGNTMYTQTKMGIISNVTPYARVLYSNNIDRNTQYRLSGMTTTTGLWRAMAELRYTFN